MLWLFVVSGAVGVLLCRVCVCTDGRTDGVCVVRGERKGDALFFFKGGWGRGVVFMCTHRHAHHTPLHSFFQHRQTDTD